MKLPLADPLPEDVDVLPTVDVLTLHLGGDIPSPTSTAADDEDRVFDAEGRTELRRELEARAEAGADDATSRFIRGEIDDLELGDGGEWAPEAADRFIEKAIEMFPGSVELPSGREGDR